MKRPTFDEIVENLRSDPYFLINNIDEDVFYDYILNIEDIISREKQKDDKEKIIMEEFRNPIENPPLFYLF